MLYMITGLPGAAKTLFTLARVQNDPQLKGRPVYFYNIPELKLPWIECDPKNWQELPDGSVIVIDEAQKVFPTRPTGSLTPKWIEALTEHRHRGFDFVLITQDSGLVDAYVRKLVERHFHLHRPFGLSYSRVHEFHGVSDPKSAAAVKQAISSRFTHPKDLYGVYKSATMHAVKKRAPLKVLMFPVLCLILAFLVYRGYQLTMGKKETPAAEVASVAAKNPAAVPAASVPGSRSASMETVLPRDAREYLEVFTPRSRNHPASAPIFDKLVAEVKDFPRVVGCIKTNVSCDCYSQQGTRIRLDAEICYAYVANGGRFDPYKDPRPAAGFEAGTDPLVTSKSSAPTSL